MELVGRDRELAALERAVLDARRGSSRVLGITGEAGIGKTALLGVARERAEEAGMLVLEGRGAEHERDVPFGVAVDAFDDHVSTLHPRRVEALSEALGDVLPAAARQSGAGPALSGAAERFRYHRAVRGLVELLARERPVALLLDDLHWADEASLELVLHLLRRPPRAACLLAFALRPSEVAPRLLDAARAVDGFEHMELAPLSREVALGLLEGLPELVSRERVARAARGNPLFLRELARVARDPDGPLPPTLLAAVQLEVSVLAPVSQTLLAGAAAAGDPFDPELAGAAAGLDAGAAAHALDELVAADLVRPTGNGPAFSFRHPLVRRAVYDAAAPAWRLSAHGRVAATLEVRRAAPALLAYHVERYARPGDERAIALLTEAAAAAAGASPATAARWYAAVTRLLPHDERRRADVLGPMAHALAGAGRLQESRAALVEALELLPPGLSCERIELVTACAEVEVLMGRYADARRRLLDALEQSASDKSRAALALQLAVAALWSAELADLRKWSLYAIGAAADIGDAAMLASAEAVAAVGADWSTDAGVAAAAVDRAAARLEALDDEAVTDQIGAALHVARAQLLTERFAGAAATATRALTLAGRTARAQLVAPLLGLRARALTDLLDLDGALRDIEAAEETARLQGLVRPLHFALWRRALVHHHRGEGAEARRVGAECLALAATLEPSEHTRSAGWQIAAIGAEEDAERVLRELQPAADAFLERVHPTWPSSLALVLVRTAIAVGQLNDAEGWAARALVHAQTLGLPASAVRASTAHAEVLLAHGDAAAAARVADRAAAAADAIPALLDAADARLLAGRAFAAAGDVDAAKERLQRVAADAGRGGALRLVDAAARELRRLGTRVSAPGRRAAGIQGEQGLTERERHIAELVAQGLTNKQVGAELFVSEKTIEHALTRVYGKLDVRSRVELTARLARA